MQVSGGARWRNEAIEQSGKSQFPYMVDPNTGTTLLESDAIVEYLYNSYGPGQVSWLLRNPDFANASNRLALRLRKDMGRNKVCQAQLMWAGEIDSQILRPW